MKRTVSKEMRHMWPRLAVAAALGAGCAISGDRGDNGNQLEAAGFEFPQEIGEFHRVGTDKYDDAATDVSATYRLAPPSRLTLTVFSFPVPMSEDGRPLSLETHCEGEIAVVVEENDARAIPWPNAFITRNDEAVRAFHGAFSFAAEGAECTSLLQVYDYGSRRLKLRITYPSTDRHAPDAIEAFHRAFPWPSASSRAGR